MSDCGKCSGCGIELDADNVWEPGLCRLCFAGLSPAELLELIIDATKTEG